MDAFRLGELWGDGAGAAAALDTDYAATTTFLTDHQCDIIMHATLSGTACTSVELRAEISIDGGTTWTVVPLEYIDESGVRVAMDCVVRRDGGVATHVWEWKLPHETLARISAKRTAGAVDTSLLLIGSAREPFSRPDPMATTPGASDDVNVAEIGGVAVSATAGVQDVDVTNVASLGGEPIQPYVPYDGGGQAINIAAAATTSTQLTVGEVYEVTAEAPCYWTWGGAGIAATTADAYMMAGDSQRITIPDAGHSYVSCIRQLTNVTGGFHICRVS